MGRSIPHKGANVTMDKAHPRWIWDVFHVLKYQHWSHLKKRFPQKKRLGNKHGVEPTSENIDVASNPEKGQEHSDSLIHDCNVEEKTKNSSLATKKSIRARIKTRISDEFSKKKGRRHRRSTTCPVQLNQSDPLDHIESPDGHPLSEKSATVESPRISLQEDRESSTPSSHNKVSNSYNPNVAGMMGPRNQNAGEHEKQANEGMFLQEKFGSNKKIEQLLMQAKEVSADASFNQPKDYLDANDIMNIHKELYAKILHDPGSPLARHFHSHQTGRANIRFGKSGSFPLPASDRRPVTGKLKQNQEGNLLYEKEDWKAEGNSQAQSLSKSNPTEVSVMPMENITAEDMQKHNQATGEKTNNLSSDVVHPLKKKGHNQRVKQHFKDLRRKIKHVIKNSRNEKNPITMDGILHKIPHGQMSSEEARDDVLNKLKNTAPGIIGKEGPGSSYEEDMTSSPGKKIQGSINRAELHSESLDKYCQLYESSFSKGSAQPVSEKLKLKNEDAYPENSVPKHFGRIKSLPNLKYYSQYTEDSSLDHPSDSWDSYHLASIVDIAGSSTRSDSQDLAGDIKSNLVVEDHGETTRISNCEANARVNMIIEDLGDLCAEENSYSDQEDTKHRGKSEGDLREQNTDPNLHKDKISSGMFSFSEDPETKPPHLPNYGHDFSVDQHLEPSMVISEVGRVHSHKVKDLSRQSDSDLQYFLVDAKDKANFDYVRDVLELSGFSRNEFLGMWHSDDQPVDPSVFGEVEGCLFHDPDCSGNKEGGNCSHLLLFDLINHVLMEVYERSLTYYPRPLTSLSHVHPMPAGYHVLEEVWALVRWYLSYRPEFDQSLDYISTRDLSKNHGWMNLQYDNECVGLELEDMIFDDLLDEVCT